MDDRSWIPYAILILVIFFQMKKSREKQMLIAKQADEINLLRSKLTKPEYKIAEISIAAIVGEYLMLKIKTFGWFLLNKMKDEIKSARASAGYEK